MRTAAREVHERAEFGEEFLGREYLRRHSAGAAGSEEAWRGWSGKWEGKGKGRGEESTATDHRVRRRVLGAGEVRVVRGERAGEPPRLEVVGGHLSFDAHLRVGEPAREPLEEQQIEHLHAELVNVNVNVNVTRAASLCATWCLKRSSNSCAVLADCCWRRVSMPSSSACAHEPSDEHVSSGQWPLVRMRTRMRFSAWSMACEQRSICARYSSTSGGAKFPPSENSLRETSREQPAVLYEYSSLYMHHARAINLLCLCHVCSCSCSCYSVRCENRSAQLDSDLQRTLTSDYSSD